MKIYIEGGSHSVKEALEQLVDDKYWINGSALKRFVKIRESDTNRIWLIERRRWFGLFGAKYQKIIVYLSNYTSTYDYYSKVFTTKGEPKCLLPMD